MEKNVLFGVPIVCGTAQMLIAAAKAQIGRGGLIATVNPRMLMQARRDPSFRDILCGALCLPDGVGVRYALGMRGIFTDVLPGVALGEILLEAESPKVAFLGASPGVARRAFDRLKERHPDMEESFILDGYTFSEEDVLARLAKTRPDLCYICLGTPAQEQLAARLLPHAPRTLFVGLGGSFDVYAGDVSRAPAAVRNIGAEWLYRMLSEPRRLAGLPDLIAFSALSLRDAATAFLLKRHPKTGKY